MNNSHYLRAATIVFVLWASLSGNLSAQQIDYQQPANSSYLAENALSPRLFNLLVSPMYQEEYKFSAKTSVRTASTSDTSEFTHEIIYDPFTDYGLSLEMRIHDPSIYDSYSKSNLRKSVGRTYEIYKKVREKDMIEEAQVGLVSDDGENVVLGFKLNKRSLPRNLQFFKNLDGRVFLSNGALKAVELTLNEGTVKINGMVAYSVLVRLEFIPGVDGGYLLSRSLQEYKGSKKGESIEIVETLDIIEYYAPDGEVIVETGTTMMKQDSPDVFKVKLERALPILGNAARKAGYELPLPFGVDLFTHFQKEDLTFETIILDGQDLTDGVLAPGQSTAEAITNLISARGDVWILPFLNLNIAAGYIDGSTDITLALSDEVKEILGLLDVDAENIAIKTPVTGPMLGAGATVAGGYKNVFATINFMYINQFVNEANTEVHAVAITPLIGLRFPRIVNVVAGGQYQLYDTKVSGSFTVEGESVDYTVDMKATRWNWLVGLQRDFSNHFNGTIMVGGQPRPQTTVVLGYRF